MAFISGPFTRCSAFRWTPGSNDPVGRCTSTVLAIVRESYDGYDKIVVGEQRCTVCGAEYLFSRRLTPAERQLPQVHLQPVRTTAADVPVSKGSAMRLFDTDRVGAYLDGVNLRLEKTKDDEHKVIDLTLRVQPFTPALATALHPDVRALLFSLKDATPKPLLKAVALNLPNVPNQHVDCFLLPEALDAGAFTLLDAEISDPRVRTEKGIDGYALIFYATIGPVGREELEYVTNWYTQQRFLTFRESQATMNFDAKAESETAQDDTAVRHIAKRGKLKDQVTKAADKKNAADKKKGPMAGDEVRPGVHAEH